MGIFDTTLDSMLSNTPIEVDGVGEGNAIQDIVPPKMKEEPPKKEEEDIEKDLIDLDESSNEEESEDNDGVEDQESQEEPSSVTEQSPQKSKGKTSSPLTPYAKLLVDEGVLPNLDIETFDGTADGLKEAMVTEIIGAVDNYKESLPDRIKDLINNYEDGVPLEKLLELDKIEVEVAKVTEETLEEDTSLQKKLVGDYLRRTTKFSETKIAKVIDGYEDSGELEEEAKTSLTELKTLVVAEKEAEKKNSEKQAKLAEETRKRDLQALEEKVKTTNEIIPGMKLNEKVKKNLFASMTTPVGYDQTGRPVNRIVAARMENPVEFEMKLHYLFEITKGFTDFTKLSEKGKNDTAKSFEKAISELDNTKFEEQEKPILGKKSEDFLKSLGKVYKI